MQARLALDRNPAEPCCKLMFVGGRSGQREKLGHMLLACDEDGSALRGMRIREDLRGRGLSKLLLAVWLRLYRDAGHRARPCAQRRRRDARATRLVDRPKEFPPLHAESDGHVVQILGGALLVLHASAAACVLLSVGVRCSARRRTVSRLRRLVRASPSLKPSRRTRCARP